MAWFDGFNAAHHDVNGQRIFARTGGAVGSPPLLLLHGYPQTHALWHRVAQLLAHRFFLVMPDLRGYGASSKPPGGTKHVDYSKREMAADLAALMASLGHTQYGVCGHDRGGRVAHRLALDHPQQVTKLCLIDIAPTLDMYEATNMAFARAYYHWFHLIQPEPLPERMIGADAVGYLHAKLGGWGASGMGHIESEALADYEAAIRDPATVHAICEDYRASAGIDLVHDRASRAAGEKIACDVHLIWGERGVVHKLFDPMALWQAQCAAQVTGTAVASGHFIPEELPGPVAQQIAAFF